MSLTIENTPGLVPGFNQKGKMEKEKRYRVAKDAPLFRYNGEMVKPGDELKPTPTGITLLELKGRLLIEEIPEKAK